LSDSMGLVHDIEKKNKDWNAEEDRDKLKQSFHPETNFSEPLVKKIYLNTSSGVNYPVKKSDGIKLSLEIARDAIKKVKEEKESRRTPAKKEDFESRAAEIDEEKFIEQLKKKLDAEEKRRRDKSVKSSNNIVSNQTREALEAVKENSHQYIAKMNDKVAIDMKAFFRDRYNMLMLMSLFVILILIVLISLRPARRLLRLRRERRGPELPRSAEDGETGPGAGGWQSWSPWSAQRRHQQKLK